MALVAALMPGVVPAHTRITPDDLLDAVMDKTVTFYELTSGTLAGAEQFVSRTLSVWRRAEEGCVDGRITTPDGKLCFLYDNEPGPVCWWPFIHQGRLLVRVARRGDGEFQQVGSMSGEGLGCPAVPIS